MTASKLELGSRVRSNIAEKDVDDAFIETFAQDELPGCLRKDTRYHFCDMNRLVDCERRLSVQFLHMPHLNRELTFACNPANAFVEALSDLWQALVYTDQSAGAETQQLKKNLPKVRICASTSLYRNMSSNAAPVWTDQKN